MPNRRREDVARLFQIATGIEHVVDFGPVLGPLLDLVEVAVVRNSDSSVSSSDDLLIAWLPHGTFMQNPTYFLHRFIQRRQGHRV